MNRSPKNIIATVVLLFSALVAVTGIGDENVYREALLRINPPVYASAKEDDDDGNDDADDQDGQKATNTAPDLSHPSVIQAIERERERAAKEAAAKKEEEWQGFKQNNEKLLTQHKKLQEQFEDLQTKIGAKNAGMDEEKFRKEVETAAQAKYDSRKGELDEMLKEARNRAESAEQKIKELEEKEFDSWLESELVKASIPEGVVNMVQPGAWPDLKRRVRHFVSREEDGDGVGIPRIKKNGSLVPGDGGDGYMTLKELLSKARMGKDPLPGVSYLFVSAGQGSATKSASGAPPRAAKWSSMSNAEKSAFVAEHGAQAAQEAMQAENIL